FRAATIPGATGPGYGVASAGSTEPRQSILCSVYAVTHPVGFPRTPRVLECRRQPMRTVNNPCAAATQVVVGGQLAGFQLIWRGCRIFPKARDMAVFHHDLLYAGILLPQRRRLMPLRVELITRTKAFLHGTHWLLVLEDGYG